MNTKFNLIMLIDDDEPTNVLSTLVIEDANCCNDIISFLKAPKAIDYLKETEDADKIPDLILLDINMPEMNGWEFLEAYKKIELNTDKKPIIIMVTTSKNPDDSKRAESIELLSGFYLKPLSYPKLSDIMNSIMASNFI